MPIRFADFVLDCTEHRLQRGGTTLHLQPKSFMVLQVLARQPGHLFTKEQLIDRVWAGQVVTDGALTRCIKEIRKVLEDDAQHPDLIETIPRVGYRFVGVTSGFSPLRGRKAAIGTVLTLVVGLTVLLIFNWPTAKQPARRSGTATTANPVSERIDVTALNADRFEQQGWANLSLRGRHLMVAQESFEKALAIDPRDAGAKSGLAITLLIAWRGRRDDPVFRQHVNALITQALEIAPNLAAAHAARGFQQYLDPSQKSQAAAEVSLRKALSLDPSAFEAMNWLSSMLLSQGRLKESITLKRKALKIYPSHATLTGNRALSLVYSGRFDEARQLMDSHRQIAGGGSPMNYPMSSLANVTGHLDEAVQIQAAALIANPDFNFYMIELAVSLARLDRFKQARNWLQRARMQCASEFRLEEGLNKLKLRAGEFASLNQSTSARYGEGSDWSAESKRGYQLWAGFGAVTNQDFATGITLLRDIYPDPEAVRGRAGDFVGIADNVHYLVYAYQKTGQQDLARPYLEKVAAEIAFRWAHGFSGFSFLTAVEAMNQTLLGHASRGMDLLERAVTQGWRGYNELVHDRRWDALHSNPRFDRLKKTLPT